MSMTVIALPRGAGKTEAMLEWLLDSPTTEHRILVSYSLQESHRVMRYALVNQQLPLETWQFVSLEEVDPRTGVDGLWSGVEYADGSQGLHRDIVLGLDNVELMLSRLLGRPIGAMSVTPG